MALTHCGGGYFYGCDNLKKIKLFFIRNYQRFIRFLISLSAVSALAFGVLSVSATSTYPFVVAQPQLTGNNCYIEFVTANNWKQVIYVSLLPNMFDGSTDVSSASVGFVAYVADGWLHIGLTSDIPSNRQLYGFVLGPTGDCVLLKHVEVGNKNDSLVFYLGNSGAITGIHGYNCEVSGIARNHDFIFTYGADTSFNNLLISINSLAQQGVNKINSIADTLLSIYLQDRSFFSSVNMEQILKAIQDNKSSAEKSEYSSPDTSNATQYESAESELMNTTSSGRSAAVDSMKGIGGLLDNHVGKALLATSKLMSEFLGIDWLGDIVHFSLVCGLFAFVLGLSVYIFFNAGSNTRVADRRADTTNLHRNRLGK